MWPDAAKPESRCRSFRVSSPESFSIDIPVELTDEIRTAGGNREAIYQIGTDWCIAQCRDLLEHGVPAVHFYTMGKAENIVRILRECF